MRLGFTASAAITVLALATGAASAQSNGASVIQGIGEPRSVIQVGSVGTLLESIHLAIPDGRHQFAPRLDLVYTSSSGLRESGVGWHIDIGKIERSTAHGVPSLAPTNEFAFFFAGTEAQLIAIGGQAYRARIENTYQQFTFDGMAWTMLDNQGITYRFGTSDASRVSDVSWALDSIQDRNGNTISYSYERDGEVLYISEIRYTGHAPSNDPGFNRVSFRYEERPDQRVTYGLGVRQEMRRRLVSVSAFAGSQLVRRYLLEHADSPVNGRSLLQAVTLVGADEVSSVRPRQYGYRSRTPGWNITALNDSLPAAFTSSDGKDLGVRAADVNGDGFTDIVDNGRNVYLGDGAGSFFRSQSWSNSFRAANIDFVDGDGVDTGGRLIDVNGDLKPDLLVANAGRREVYLNNGSGWEANVAFTLSLQSLSASAMVKRKFLDPACTGDNPPSRCDDLVLHTEQLAIVDSHGDSKGIQFADVNGDGLVDILWSFSRTTNVFNLLGLVPVQVTAVYLNTGTGWALDSRLSAALPITFVDDSSYEGWDTMDVNGDGLADLVRTMSSQPRQVLLGTGSGWTLDAGFTDSLSASDIVSLDGDGKSQGLLPIDFNDDGLIDYIRADESVVAAYRNTGRGWTLDSTVTFQIMMMGLSLANGDGVPQGVVTGDVDGNGVTDLLQFKDSGTSAIHLATGATADLLVDTRTALGEMTHITYAPSSTLDNTGGDEVQDLPLVLQVPVSLARSDGRTSTFVTSYTYSGGVYDGVFRGFRQSETTDPRGTRMRTTYLQSDPFVGQVSVDEKLDMSDAVRWRRTNTYSSASLASGVTQVRMVQTDEEVLDAGGTLHTRTRFVHDAFLNQVTVFKDGDVTVTGDESRTDYTRALNLNAGITSLPSRITVFGPNGELLSRSTILYDGLPEGSVSIGNPTTLRDLMQTNGTSETVRTIAYDQFGNVSSATDHEGNTTMFEYDDDQHAFQRRVVDPLGHVLKSEFDMRWGVATRDVNWSGNPTAREYDSFGRMTAVREPGDECSPQPTRKIEYSPLGDATRQTVTVRQAETPGSAGTFDMTSYLDGFAQVYRVESEGASGRTIVVTTEFDDAGFTTSSSRPFFAGDASSVSRFGYDALHRPVSLVEPDGLAETLSYAGARVDVVDRRGSHTAFVKNAYGKIVDTIQSVHGALQHTRYEYDAFGHPVAVTNALGEVTRIAYDALGRRIRLDDPNAGAFLYEYDGNGKLLAQTSPDGRITRYRYDPSGQLLEKRFPDGRADVFHYGDNSVANAVGRVVRVEDGAGTIEVRYDPRGNVVMRRRTVESRTYVTATSYDSMGRIRRITYPDGFQANYEYNTAGYVEKVMDGDGQMIVDNIDYTAAGQIASIRYGNAVDTTYNYDALARLTTIATVNQHADRLQDLGYTYDGGGNIIAIRDRAFDHSETFEYDELNRLVESVGPYGDETYEYDTIGNLLRKGSLVFAIDSTHRQRVTCGIDLSLASAPANGILNNPHLSACADALLDPSRGHRPPDRAAVDVIKARGTANNPNIGQSFSVGYDALGNVVEKNGQRFIYDSENHLVRIEDPNGRLVEANVYDGVGARVIQRTESDQTVFIDDVFEINKSQAARHVRVGSLLVATIVTPGSHVDLIDDIDDDPLTACAAGDDASGGGCLVVGHGSGRSQAVLAGLFVGVVLITRKRRQIRRHAREVFARVASRPGATAVLVVLLPAYLLQATRPAHATPPAPKAEQRFFYHLDHLGSTTVISDERGAVVEQRNYKPFGEQYVRTGAQGGPRDLEISFNSHRWDAASGLYYFGARHYDPVLGRFLSADTEVPDPSDPRAFHRYAFNYNNPIRYIDPTGHGFVDFLKGIVFVLAAVLVIALVIVITLGTGGLATPFGAAVIWAAVLGAVAGGIIGVATASFLGYKPWDANFWQVVAAGAVLGAFIGAAIGAISAMPVVEAAAAESARDASLMLVGAASGSLFGGIAAAQVNHGITGDFAMDFFLGGVVAAAAVYGYGAGAFAHLGLFKAGAYVVGLSALISYSYCKARGACSPEDPTGDNANGPVANSVGAESYGVNGPLTAVSDSAGSWIFEGTIVNQFQRRDPSAVRGARAPFQTMPLVP